MISQNELLSHKGLHSFWVPLTLTLIWGIGAILSQKGNWMFISIINDPILYNLGILYAIFFLETAIMFFDLSIQHNTQNFSNRLLRFFGSIMLDIFAAVGFALVYLDRGFGILLFFVLISVCLLKFLCLRLQNNISKYFTNNNNKGQTFEPISVINLNTDN